MPRSESSSTNLRVVFLQSFFERSAEVRTEDRLVVLYVSSFHLLNILRLLNDLGVAARTSGTEPVSVAVSLDDAARVPLFNPKAESEKYQQVISLISTQ